MTSPQLVIIGGPNGSGKSTLTDLGKLSEYQLALPEHYINPDAIAKEVHEENIVERDRLAWEKARGLRQYFREQGVSFAFETVFSHPSTLIDMQKCRQAGYHVTLLYVATGSVDLNVARVAGRVRQGGHGVPEDRIRSRYVRSLRLMPRAVEDADRAMVFDSSGEGSARLCFQKFSYGSVHIALPQYLKEGLADAMAQREFERDSLLKEFGKIRMPDEQAGRYVGPIRVVLSNYAVQEVEQGDYIRHDLLLADEMTAESSRVVYKDGAAHFS